jgi:hypothetical protein
MVIVNGNPAAAEAKNRKLRIFPPRKPRNAKIVAASEGAAPGRAQGDPP